MSTEEKIYSAKPEGTKHAAYKHGRRGAGDTLFALFIFLFMRLSSWICSIPAWLTLILHFTVSLSIWWFWGTLAAWLLAGLIRFAVIRSAVALSSGIDDRRENKNPYSNKQI